MGRTLLFLLLFPSLFADHSLYEAGKTVWRDFSDKVNWERVHELTKDGPPAIKEAIIVCHNYPEEIRTEKEKGETTCQSLALELLACGIKAHIVDESTSEARVAHIESLRGKVSPHAPLFFEAHGTVNMSVPHKVKFRDRTCVDSSLVIKTLRASLKTNPIIWNTCGSGNCVAAHKDDNIMGLCAGNTDGTRSRLLGVAKYLHSTRTNIPLMSLLCSKKRFDALAVDGYISSQKLHEYFKTHPLYAHGFESEETEKVVPVSKLQ